VVGLVAGGGRVVQKEAQDVQEEESCAKYCTLNIIFNNMSMTFY
jgi:hypothetical protein